MKIQHIRLANLLPIVVLVITQLHLLRNASPIYFLGYLISFVGALWFLIYRWHLISSVEKIAIWLILAMFFFPLISMLPGVVAGKYDGLGDVAIGVSRVLFSLPIYLAIIASPSNKEFINKLLIAAAFITFIAAISIPYQFLFGQIEWFTEGSERAGFSRYASLFGSLTSLGIVIGYGILAAILSLRSDFLAALVVSGIIFGGGLSLQKAAIINIILCILVLPFIRRIRIKSVIRFMILFLVIFVVVGSYFGDEVIGYLSSFRLFSDSESSYTDDVSVSESILDRFIELPTVAINYHGYESLLFGIGPIGGSGAFGFPDVPMSHNGIVDLLLVGGIGYFILFFAFIAFVFYTAVRGKAQVDVEYLVRFGIFSFFIQLLNIPFTGLIFFAPSNALFFALSLKCIMLKSRKVTDR